MRRLARTFAARIGDKYQICLTRSIYRNLALTYTSDMMQIFDNNYVTLSPFSRSFEYLIFTLGSEHASFSAH